MLSMQGKWRVNKMLLLKMHQMLWLKMHQMLGLKMHQMLWLMWLHQTRVVAPGATLGLQTSGNALYMLHMMFAYEQVLFSYLT